MNFRKIITVLASGLAFCASLRAADLAMNNASLPNNPYAPIITRNVFNLNPPAPDAPPPAPDLPKITPNGIMSVFGQVQVLFKASKAGAKDEYYTLSEGVGQDDIEVMHIDDKNGIITFKNHGTIQEIPLVAAPSTGGAPASPSPLPGFNPGNNGGNPSPNNRMGRFGNRGGPSGFNRRGSNNQDTSGATDDGSLNLRSIPSRTYQPQASTMSPEESALTIEAQRAAALDAGDPKAALFPPTPLTGRY